MSTTGSGSEERSGPRLRGILSEMGIFRQTETAPLAVIYCATKLIVEMASSQAVPTGLAQLAFAAPAYKGMSYTSFGTNVLSSAGSDQSLLNMSMVGTDTVALNFWWFQNSTTANSMAEDFTRYSSTVSSISHAIDTIHSLGMKVLLKPMLDVSDAAGTWRAYINPSDKDQWFANYTNFLGTFADMAQTKGVELFSVGCETEMNGRSYSDSSRSSST